MTQSEMIHEQRIIRQFAETMLGIRCQSTPMGNLSRANLIAIIKDAAEQYAADWIPEGDEAKFIEYVIDDLPPERERAA